MRIIVADHHAHVLRSLKQTLLEIPEYDLIGEAVNARGLLALAGEQNADRRTDYIASSQHNAVFSFRFHSRSFKKLNYAIWCGRQV